MTEAQFDALVSQLEAAYKGRHPALARRSAFLAILGYGGLAFFLIAGLALTLLAAAWILYAPSFLSIKVGLVVGIPSAILTFAIIRGLWVRLTAPEGIPVHRRDCPELFQLIDSISRQAGGVKFNQVLLTGELNAAVVQIPRLGVFGWHKTYLILGVPLLDALTPDEFTAVLAHEFAHLSHRHGRLGNWLYRLRVSWVKVMASLSEQGAPRPVIAFINWFWPRFNASAFVLSRAQEYQADAFAAKVTSPQSSAMALQRIAIESQRLDEGFWNDIGRSTASTPRPPEDVFHRMHAFLGTAADPHLENRWLEDALSIETGTADTHPGLKDRLAALGVSATAGSTGKLDIRASDAFLGTTVAMAARDKFSLQWQEHVSPRWQEDHQTKRKIHALLEGISPSTREGKWQQLFMRARLHGVKSIQEELLGFLIENPEHPPANYFRGMHLASEADAAAIAHLEKASERPDLFEGSLNMLAGLYDRLGRSSEISTLKNRAHFNFASMQRAFEERNSTRTSDRFLPPELGPEEQSHLMTLLQRHEAIRGAWVARKKVSEYPAWRSYVLVLAFPRGMRDGAAMEILREVVEGIFVDAHFLAILHDGDETRTAEAVMGSEGSLLLKR
ncbi:M48 family metallopeptidase [Luteolibacter sp. GHJ8]|uniref:M48 family metallopeptidase n=1 Tax=Luteolibacter rhizosphaerae TaxID=2989719 RepID=A0ABT3G6S1_9BACT|nr:M48 family metallopeptidase [Luteolibacter rhizosphaerae]MCW1915196.1 M48 family metallopeptidase [Luteolibacter rhizosphaerae]